MAYAALAPAFEAAAAGLLTREAMDVDLSKALIFFLRVGTGAAGSDTVRAAQANLAAAAPASRRLIDMDAYPRPDATHWPIAGLDYAGATGCDAAYA